MNSEKQLIGEEVAPGPSGSLKVASLSAFAGSAPADKSVLKAHHLLQVLLKLLFHLQQKERRALSQTNVRSKMRKQQKFRLDTENKIELHRLVLRLSLITQQSYKHFSIFAVWIRTCCLTSFMLSPRAFWLNCNSDAFTIELLLKM